MKAVPSNNLDLSDSSKLKTLVHSFKADKVRNANVIVDLLKKLEEDNISQLRGGLAGIHKIFCLLLKDGDIRKPKGKISKLSATEKYDLWLCKRYSEVHKQLLELSHHLVPQVQELSLQVVLKLLQKEAQYPLHKGGQSFPITKLQGVLSSLVSRKVNNSSIVKHLEVYIQCDDFLFYTVRSMSKIISEVEDTTNPVLQSNVLDILEIINVREQGAKMLAAPKQFKDISEGTENSGAVFKLPYAELLRDFNKIWETVLSWTLSEAACKRCLVLLPEKVMIHLENPVRLTDFFINSYQRGGASALMALHGVFILITKYNIEYPNFFGNVYSMLEPSLFQTKYRARFFILLDKFLSSTHLPEYILFAFAKRLSRLLLVAPSSCLILLLKFITNLLVSHPSLRKLIHNPDGGDFTCDPFLDGENDLSKCLASQSSLWEVSTLLHHPVPVVSKAARFIERNMPEAELGIAKHVEDSYDDIYDKCAKIYLPETSTTFIKPQSLFIYPDDEMSQVWSIL